MDIENSSHFPSHLAHPALLPGRKIIYRLLSVVARTQHFEDERLVDGLIEFVAHHNVVGFAAERGPVFVSAGRKNQLAEGVEGAVVRDRLQGSGK